LHERAKGIRKGGGRHGGIGGGFANASVSSKSSQDGKTFSRTAFGTTFTDGSRSGRGPPLPHRDSA
jgi:hypothetical protein